MAYASYTVTQEVDVTVEQSIHIEDKEGVEIEVLEYDIDEDDIRITIDGCIKTDDDEVKVEVFDEAGKKVSLIEDEYDDNSEPNKVTLEGFVISKEEMHEYKRLKQASNDMRILLYVSEDDKKNIEKDINQRAIWLIPDKKDALGTDYEPWTVNNLVRCTLEKDDLKTILRSMAGQIVDKLWPEEKEEVDELTQINEAIGKGLDAAGESKHPVHNLGTITISEDSKHKIENPKTNLHIKDDTGNEEATQEILNSIGISDQ
tara:strand:+ start:1999 stop:2778 length:780 start_codon:yes stop_codon:yes gene_type:complete